MSAGFRQFVPVFLSIAATGFAFGLILPVTSVILENMSVSTPLIGLTATAMFFGITMGSTVIGRFIKQYGVKYVLVSGLIVAASSMFILPLWVSVPSWIFIRFILGIGLAAVFISIEIFISRVSTETNRGKNLGLYGLFFSISLMIVPVGLWLLNFGLWLPFTVAGLACLVSSTHIFIVLPELKEDSIKHKVTILFIRRISFSLGIIMITGFMEGALMALIPVYTLRQGFDPLQMSVLLVCFFVGHGMMPPFIGILGDKFGFGKALVFSILSGLLAFCIILLNPQNIIILAPAFIIAGSSVGGLYPVGIGLLAVFLTSSELPKGNSLTTFCYGIGSIFGPLLPAIIMHYMGAPSLFVVSIFIYSFFLSIWLLRGRSISDRNFLTKGGEGLGS